MIPDLTRAFSNVYAKLDTPPEIDARIGSLPPKTICSCGNARWLMQDSTLCLALSSGSVRPIYEPCMACEPEKAMNARRRNMGLPPTHGQIACDARPRHRLLIRGRDQEAALVEFIASYPNGQIANLARLEAFEGVADKEIINLPESTSRIAGDFRKARGFQFGAVYARTVLSTGLETTLDHEVGPGEVSVFLSFDGMASWIASLNPTFLVVSKDAIGSTLPLWLDRKPPLWALDQDGLLVRSLRSIPIYGDE